MKVLMISSDEKIFDKNSSVRRRIVEYGSLVEELHVIVFSRKGIGNTKEVLSGNVHAHSTNSVNRWFYIKDAVRIGKDILKKNSPNLSDFLITCQDPFESGLAGFFIASKTKIKLQLQIHTDFLSPYFSFGSFLNKVRIILAMILLPKADCIRVVSERIKSSVVGECKINPSKISVLPIFADLEKFNSDAKEGRRNQDVMDLHKKYPQFKKIVLMVSRLEKEKNIPLAISAFVQTLKKHPKSGLVIVGDGRERGKLEKWIKAYSIEKSVVFAGWQEDVVDYYKFADLFVSSSNYEGYGLSILEAYASGLPILTTDVGLVGDVIKKEDIYICPVGDIECFISKMNISLSGELKPSRKFDISLEVIITKKEYLSEYKKHWEKCTTV